MRSFLARSLWSLTSSSGSCSGAGIPGTDRDPSCPCHRSCRTQQPGPTRPPPRARGRASRRVDVVAWGLSVGQQAEETRPRCGTGTGIERAGSLTDVPAPLTLLTVHAHPDDEASKGAATLAKYHA